MKVSTKFKVDTTIRCVVLALLLLICYVTLCPWPSTFWSWSVVIHGGSYGQSLYQVWRSYGYPFLSSEFWISHRIPLTMRFQPLRMRRITWPMRSSVGQIFSHIFEIPDPDLPIHCATFMALRLRQMELSTKTVYGPVAVLKITQLSAHAQSHASIERWGRFLLIFAMDKLNVRIFLLPV